MQTTINREDVVRLMTDKIESMNREVATKHGMPFEQIEKAILETRNELDRVNTMLFDLLVERGVINV